MKNLLVAIALSFPIFLFSQSQVEIIGSLDFTNRIFTNDGLVQSVRSSEKGKLNTHFGVNYHQKLRKNLWLKLGVGFASLGYKTKDTNLIFADEIILSGVQDTSILGGRTSRLKYNFHFIEIPLALRYDFSDKKFRAFAEFGLSPMYYIQTVTKQILEEETGKNTNTEKYREKEINQIQISTVLALGVSYAINEKIELVFKPNFRFHLTKIADAPVKEREWSGGVALGARVALK